MGYINTRMLSLTSFNKYVLLILKKCNIRREKYINLYSPFNMVETTTKKNKQETFTANYYTL